MDSIAVSAAEEHPEYFGTYPAPLYTPWGYTLRHRTFENGVYWLETDQCEEVLAVCYPLWDAKLSDAVQSMGKQTSFDRKNDIHQTMGYLFFSHPAACAAIYELMETRPEWNGSLIDKSALMNAIWKHLPDYAVLSNWWELKGVHAVRDLLKAFYGITMEPQLDPDHLVTIFPEAGENYLLFSD